MKNAFLLAATHVAALMAGVALGIYFLPILAAPPAPTLQDVQAASQGSLFSAEFRRDLKGSDALHWGEGRVTLSRERVTFAGELAPGPAYRLYLAPEYVETKEDFLRVKSRSVAVSDIRTFENFIAPIPAGTNLEQHTTVVVWCEAFSQFITAAKYR